MGTSQEILNIPEVAKFLRISRNRAYDLAATDPTFPVIRIGRRLIVRRRDLCTWLDDHKRTGVARR